MKVENWLSAVAAANPEREALVAGDERLTYLELEQRARAAAAALRATGVKAQDRVVVALPGGIDFAVLMHGLIKVGALLAPLDPEISERQARELIETLEPALMIRDPGEVAPLDADEEVDDQLELDAPFCIIQTSGSGGAPKAVELTYANQLWSAVGCGMRIGMRADDRWLCCLPTHHVGGLAILVRCAVYGATAVVERFEAKRTAITIERERITIVSLVATMLDRLLDAGLQPHELRCALLGGGPAPASLVERSLAEGIPVAPTYGLTEACSQVTTLPPDQVTSRPGSSGTPIASLRVRIGDDGRIEVAGPTVAAEARADDGWLHTGDLGRMEDGHLYVLGRADEVIVTGGENVSPEEVERVLVEHPVVADAAVFGRDDPQWQRAVVALVVPNDDGEVDASQLHDFCRERLPGFKVPKQIQVVDRLPRNAQGKLLRAELS